MNQTASGQMTSQLQVGFRTKMGTDKRWIVFFKTWDVTADFQTGGSLSQRTADPDNIPFPGPGTITDLIFINLTNNSNGYYKAAAAVYRISPYQVYLVFLQTFLEPLKKKIEPIIAIPGKPQRQKGKPGLPSHGRNITDINIHRLSSQEFRRMPAEIKMHRFYQAVAGN